MTDADTDEILTLDEVAAYLKAGKKTVYRLAQQGQIPGFKLGGTWRFRRTELHRWMATQTGALAAAPNAAIMANKTQDKT
jgi:excisionase family DNA binding protein